MDAMLDVFLDVCMHVLLDVFLDVFLDTRFGCVGLLCMYFAKPVHSVAACGTADRTSVALGQT